jgi:hypothetical protein
MRNPECCAKLGYQTNRHSYLSIEYAFDCSGFARMDALLPGSVAGSRESEWKKSQVPGSGEILWVFRRSSRLFSGQSLSGSLLLLYACLYPSLANHLEHLFFLVNLAVAAYFSIPLSTLPLSYKLQWRRILSSF